MIFVTALLQMINYNAVMAAEANSLSVGTFNIQGWTTTDFGINAWPNRAGLTIGTVNRMGTDSLGLQEFSASQNTGFYQDNLSDMKLHLGPRLDDDRYNPIAFRPNRLRIISTDVIWLHPDNEPRPATEWGADETRSATLVEFEHKQTGKRLVKINTHYDPKNERARVESTITILRRVSRVNQPIALVGDFNSSWFQAPRASYSSMSHALFVSHGFKDAYVETHPDELDPPNTFHNYQGDTYVADQFGTWHTDWILSRGFNVGAYEIWRDRQGTLPHYPSDHYPVSAQLAFT